MKRLLALLVAVGLVGGAWYLRNNVIDDDGGGGDPSTPSGEAPTLICATEVRAACARLDDVEVLRVEDPGTTYDRLEGGGELGADGWLVSQPWPAMLDVVQRPLSATSGTLARTPLVVVTTDPRPSGLTCAPATWECVATFAADGGTFAHAGSAMTSGLLTQAGIVGGLLGRPDYARNDFDDVDGFRGRYATLEEAVSDVTQGHSSDLAADIQRIRGLYQAASVLGTNATIERDGFDPVTPTPEITADVVLAGHPERFDRAAISDALFTTGWLRSGDKALSDTNGLPNPGVMVALRDLSK